MFHRPRLIWGRRHKRGSESSYPLPQILIVLLVLSSVFGCSKGTNPELAPEADFRGAPVSGSAPLTVSFNNNSSGKIDSYEWDFGDGKSSTAGNPSHTYTSPGNYTVVLTISGPGGSDTRTRSKYVSVSEATTAKFTAWWEEIDNVNSRVTMKATLKTQGYKGHSFALGGYWFRKSGSNYYYLKAECSTNVPGNYLTGQWRESVSTDTFEKTTGFVTPFSCFPDGSGPYYGLIKLYKASSIPVEVNSCTLARTGYIGVRRSSSSPSTHGDGPSLTVHVLSQAESEELERAITAAGGILPASR